MVCCTKGWRYLWGVVGGGGAFFWVAPWLSSLAVLNRSFTNHTTKEINNLMSVVFISQALKPVVTDRG